MLVISGCSTSRDDGVHQDRLAQCRPFARHAAQVHRRLHVHERQRNEFGEAAGFGLQIAQHEQMPRPVQRGFDVSIHDG